MKRSQPKWILLLIVGLISCVGGMASDIYSPSIPAIATYFNTTIDVIQWSMVIYMIGLSLSQLFYGPFSHGFGRKPIILTGLFVVLLGSFLCYFASSVEMLLLGRFIQGCGAGGCAAMWRATFRDVFIGEELAKYGSYLSVCMVFVVPAAPVIGGILQKYVNWQASFAFLGAYALLAIMLVYTLFHETSKHHHRSQLKLAFIGNTYWKLLTDKIFIGYTLCAFLTYGAFFSWFVAGPVLIIESLAYSPIAFGWISFSLIGASMAVGGFLNARLVQRFGLHAMLSSGWLMIFLAGLHMLFGYWLFGINIYALVIPVMMFYLGSTFIFANTFAGAFAHCGKVAGFAGALYGTIQVSGASVIGALAAYLPDNNQIPLACIYMGCSLAAWGFYTLVVRPTHEAERIREVLDLRA